MVKGGGMLPSFDKDSDLYELPDTNDTSSVDHTKNGLKRRLSGLDSQEASKFIYLTCLLSAMGGFMFGYDTGIVSGAMVFVKKTFHMNSLWQELTVSSTILGAWMLSLYAGSLSDSYGRKPVILWASIVFTLGSLVMGAAWSKWILLFGRLLVGLAIGLSSSVIPPYIAEVAPSKMRGSLVTLNNVAITVGQMTAAITAGAFSYDRINGWRWMLGLAAAPAAIQFVGFLFMPESPRWLIKVRRDEEALAALKLIRGSDYPFVMREFDRMCQNQLELAVQDERRRQQKRNIIVAIFRKTATRRALIVGCLLMACQQLAGINTFMYYTATIIEMTGVRSESTAVWLAVPTSVVYVIFAIFGYLIADRLGRRTITLSSLMGVIIALLILGTGFQLTAMKGAVVTHHNMSETESCFSKADCASCVADPKCGFCYDSTNLAVASCLEKDPENETRSIGGECSMPAEGSQFIFTGHTCPAANQGIGLNTWLVLIGMIMYLAAFAPGMSPMPWTINSEIYPMWARSFCYSIATSVNWLFNMLISFTFISLTELLTTHGVFYMYSVISAVFWLILFWKLPETRGRSLEDISSMFGKSKNEDQESMDEEASQGNNSVSGVLAGSYKQPVGLTGVHRHDGVGNRHDNLAFVSENLTPLGDHMVKGAAASESHLLQGDDENTGRLSPADKLSTKATSQPNLQHLDLEQQQQQQQQQLPPPQPTQQPPATPPPLPKSASTQQPPADPPVPSTDSSSKP